MISVQNVGSSESASKSSHISNLIRPPLHTSSGDFVSRLSTTSPKAFADTPLQSRTTGVDELASVFAPSSMDTTARSFPSKQQSAAPSFSAATSQQSPSFYNGSQQGIIFTQPIDVKTPDNRSHPGSAYNSPESVGNSSVISATPMENTKHENMIKQIEKHRSQMLQRMSEGIEKSGNEIRSCRGKIEDMIRIVGNLEKSIEENRTKWQELQDSQVKAQLSQKVAQKLSSGMFTDEESNGVAGLFSRFSALAHENYEDGDY